MGTPIKVYAVLEETGERIAHTVDSDRKSHLIDALKRNATTEIDLEKFKRAEAQGRHAFPRKRTDAGIAEVKAICRPCPKFSMNAQGWAICSACDCPLDHKQMIANASCPEGKWGRELRTLDRKLSEQEMNETSSK